MKPSDSVELNKRIEKLENLNQLLQNEIEARKMAQESLKEGEKFLQIILSSVEDRFVMVFDENELINFVWGPELLEKKFGIKFTDFIGKSTLEFLRKTPIEQKSRLLLQVFKSGESLSGKWNVNMPNGNFWLNYTLSPVRDGENKIVAAVIAVRDITDHVRKDEKLKESEEKYRSLTEGQLFAVIIFQDKKIVYINDALKTISGYTTEELVTFKPSQYLSFIHPEDMSAIAEGMEKREQQDEYVSQFIFRFKQKSGTYKWVEQYTHTIQYKGKLATQTTLIDVNERKKAEEKIKQSDRNFRDILNNTQNIIFKINLGSGEPNYDYISPSVEKILGWTQEEYIATDISRAENLIHPDDFIRAKSNRNKLINSHSKSASTAVIELRIKHKNGTYLWFQEYSTLVKNSKGKPLYIIDSLVNITEYRKKDQ